MKWFLFLLFGLCMLVFPMVEANIIVIDGTITPNITFTPKSSGAGVPIDSAKGNDIYIQCWFTGTGLAGSPAYGSFYYANCASDVSPEYHVVLNSTHRYINASIKAPIPYGYSSQWNNNSYISCRWDNESMLYPDNTTFKWTRNGTMDADGHRKWFQSYAGVWSSVSSLSASAGLNINNATLADSTTSTSKSYPFGHPQVSWKNDSVSLNISKFFDLSHGDWCYYINGTGNTEATLFSAIDFYNMTDKHLAIKTAYSVMFMGGFIGPGNLSIKQVDMVVIGGMADCEWCNFTDLSITYPTTSIWYQPPGGYRTNVKYNIPTAATFILDSFGVYSKYGNQLNNMILSRSATSYLNISGIQLLASQTSNYNSLQAIRYFTNHKVSNSVFRRTVLGAATTNSDGLLLLENISWYNANTTTLYDMQMEIGNTNRAPYYTMDINMTDCFSYGRTNNIPIMTYGYSNGGYSAAQNHSLWNSTLNYNMFYNVKHKIVDVYGTPITGVTINITDSNGVVYSGVTDAGGLWNTKLLYYHINYCPSCGSSVFYANYTFQGLFNYTISKTGYLTNEFVSNKRVGYDWDIVLLPTNYCPANNENIYEYIIYDNNGKGLIINN